LRTLVSVPCGPPPILILPPPAGRFGIDPRVAGQLDRAAGDDSSAAPAGRPGSEDTSICRRAAPGLPSPASIVTLPGPLAAGMGVDPPRQIDDVFEDAGHRVGGQ
jgi:hypothetical protein